MKRTIRTLLTAVLTYVQQIVKNYTNRVAAAGGVVEATSCVTTALTALDNQALLSSATFVLVPSGYKSGNVYAELPNNGNGDLTYTRASAATRFNSLGVIESVASGVPQIDYSLGGCPVLLLEPQRRNLLLNSVWAGATAGSSGTNVAPTNWSFTFNGGSISLPSSIYGSLVQAINFSCDRYTFTVSGITVTPVVGAIYTNNGNSYAVVNVNISSGSGTIVCTGSASPANSGNLIKVSGTGDSTVAFSAYSSRMFAGQSVLTSANVNYVFSIYIESYSGSFPLNYIFGEATGLTGTSKTYYYQDGTNLGNGSANVSATGRYYLVYSHQQYTFNVSGVSVIPTAGAAYINNGITFTVVSASISGGIGTIICSATSNPTSSGTLTKSTGTGDSTISFSSTTTPNLLIRYGLGISGNATGNVVLSCPQFEDNGSSGSANYPTSYIPTTTVAATRNAGNFSRNNVYTNGLISANGGTWLIELKNNLALTRDASNIGIALVDNAVANAVGINNSSNSFLTIRKYISGSPTTIYTSIQSDNKFVVKFYNDGSNKIDVFSSGLKQVNGSSFFDYTTIQQLLTNNADVPKYISQMALWNSPLTEAQCLALTSNYYTNLTVAKAYLDAHIARVNADGGTFNMSVYDQAWNYVSQLMGLYGTDLTDVPIAIDPHYFGYKIGTGSGVTANGNAAGKLYNLTGVSGDFVQGTPGNQPLLLKHTGENYWWNGGVISNYCSTPSATANQITGDIDIRARASFNSLSTSMTLISKLRSGAFSYMFRQSATGALVFTFSLDGSSNTSVSSTVIHPFSINQVGWFRVTRTAATGQVIFYTSTDGTNWTQLGSTVSSTSGNIFNSTTQVEVGSYNLGITDMLSGTIYRAQIYNGINGTLAVDFNPSSYNAATSQTTWTSATGETWTINTGTASTGYKGALVDRTQVQADAVDDFFKTNSAIAFGGTSLGINSIATLLNNVNTLNIFMELSQQSSSNNNSFVIFNSNAGGTSRGMYLRTQSSLGQNAVFSNTSPFNLKKAIISYGIDTTLSASLENTLYYNGATVASTLNPSVDQSFSFSTPYYLNIFARSLDADPFSSSIWSNMALTSLIITKNVTKRTDVELIIRNMNNNFAF